MPTFFAGLTPCLVGMEACATAHCSTLGHQGRLMPARQVKAHLRHGENDAALAIFTGRLHHVTVTMDDAEGPVDEAPQESAFARD